MKILLTLIFMLAGFAAGANAQLCGVYTTSVLVVDEANSPVDNAEIKIIPLQKKDSTRKLEFVRREESAALFFISFNEGEMVEGSYKIVVSAEGFLPAEKVVSFPHCKSRILEFRLKTGKASKRVILTRADSTELTGKPNTSKLCGTIIDEKRVVISGVSIRAKSNKKGIFKTTTDAEGNFEMEIPDGLYKIIIKQSGFKKVIMKKQLLPYDPRSCRNYILKSTVKGHKIT